MKRHTFAGRLDRLERVIGPPDPSAGLLRIVIPDDDGVVRLPPGCRLMTQEDADRLNAEGHPTLFIPDIDDRPEPEGWAQ